MITESTLVHPPVTGTMSKWEGSQQQSSEGLRVSCPLQKDSYCGHRLCQPLPVWAKVVTESTYILPDLLLQGRSCLVKLGSNSSPGSRAPEQFHHSNGPLFFTFLISPCLFALTSEMLNCEIFPTRQGLSNISRCQWASFISETGNSTSSGDRVGQLSQHV